MTHVTPRFTPDRNSKYMGLAWIHAGFSKDPNTQVGAQVVDFVTNTPIGSGYNGPPRSMNDDLVTWKRPSKNEPDALSKYDLMVHAEINAIDHSGYTEFSNCILYVTALPCPNCMLSIVSRSFDKVVYFDFQSSPNSILQNAKWRDKTFEIAKLGNVKLEKFSGNINWIQDWTENLKRLNVFEM